MTKVLIQEKIKAISIYLEGTTLLPDTTLVERTRICLQKLISKGIQVMLATGRAIESSEKYRSAIGAHGPMVFFNGAVVSDVPSGETLFSSLISMDVADYGTEIAQDLGVHYQIYLPAGVSPDTGKEDKEQKWGMLLTDRYGPEADIYYRHTGIAATVKDIKKIIKLPDLKGCIKGMFIADPSVHDEIRKRMRDRFGDQITVIRSFPTFLEVLNKGVSKGEGLRIAMDHRGLKPEEVIAFGDEENDLPMFPVAGFSAAPQSAREKIRNEADIIYGPIQEEGLAEYLEKTFL
jgi:Cof subfamily protein (haloacid dehalogenase superfamily)